MVDRAEVMVRSYPLVWLSAFEDRLRRIADKALGMERRSVVGRSRDC